MKKAIVSFILMVFMSACQNARAIFLPNSIATPASTQASLLSPQEALTQMYGENVVVLKNSKESDASMTFGEITYYIRINMLTCYWDIETDAALEKCMVITEKTPAYGGQLTGALIDGAIFERTSTGWKARYLKSNMIELGSSGQIPKGELIQIGRRKYAALLKGAQFSGGEYERLVIITETENSFGIIFQIVSSQSRNAGVADIWGYTARLQFQVTDYNQEYYDIVVRYYGTSQDGTTPPLKVYRYVDPQYITDQ